MPRLKSFVGYGVSTLFMILLLLDAFDRRLLGYDYRVPLELYGLIGTVIAGLFTSDFIRKASDAGTKPPPTGSMPATYPATIEKEVKK